MYITDLGGGKYKIAVAYDTKQGKNGGTKTESITYDPGTKKFAGSPGFFDRSSFRYAVVECPKKEVIPEFTSIAIPAATAIGLVFLFLRRRKKEVYATVD